MALAGVLLGTLEGGLHLVEDRLPEPVLWGGGEVSAKVAQASSLSGGADVLLLGPSHASIGLSPACMKEVEGFGDQKVYNGGLNGRTFTVIDFVSEHVYEPELQPKVVVVTASPVILNGNNEWMERNSAEFFNAPFPSALQAGGVRKGWGLFLAKNVNLYKFRRRERGLSKGYVSGKQVLDRFGYHAIEGKFDEEKREELARKNHPYQSIMSEHSFDGPSVDSFQALVKRLQENGSEVVVLNTPFRAELLEISKEGAADYERYLGQVKAATAELGAHWWDYQKNTTLTDEDFADVDHLNVKGARTVSMRLAQDLLQQFPALLAPGK